MSEQVPVQRRAMRKIIIDLSIMTVIGIFLAVLGPFGTISQPLGLRLLSWLGFAYLGYVIYSPMGYFVERMASTLDLPRAPLWLFAVVVATVPMTAAVWSMGFVPDPVPMPTLDQAMTSYFYVFVVGGAVTAFFYLIEQRGKTEPNVVAQMAKTDVQSGEKDDEAKTGQMRPDEASFLSRLPASLGTSLIALEMEDHYVRAHTALGNDLVLMRMRDAVAELDAIDGMQIHRSWWVARGAVEDVQREGRNVRLVLAGGLIAPVSRANVSVLKDAGWI